jgi:hypothetical protein
MRRRVVVIVAVLAMVGYTFGTAAATERALRCFGQIPDFVGTGASEIIWGTGAGEVIHGGGGNDIIYGYGGNDLLCGGAGADDIYGGKGHDSISGGGGNDWLNGQAGDDLLRGNAGKDTLLGKGGNDYLYGGKKKDVLKGGNGADSLWGNGGNDKLFGNGGNDWLLGHPGWDRVNGGAGNDTCDNRDDVLLNCGGGGGGGTPTMQTSLPASYGTDTLAPGFWPDPMTYSMTSGGVVDVFGQLGTGCYGWAAQAPDFELTYNGGSGFLRVYFVANNNSADTTLIINDPNGFWYCDDDAGLGGNVLNPMIDFSPAASGVYDIWVGSRFSGQNWGGTLNITELSGNTP